MLRQAAWHASAKIEIRTHARQQVAARSNRYQLRVRILKYSLASSPAPSRRRQSRSRRVRWVQLSRDQRACAAEGGAAPTRAGAAGYGVYMAHCRQHDLRLAERAVPGPWPPNWRVLRRIPWLLRHADHAALDHPQPRASHSTDNESRAIDDRERASDVT